MCLPYPLNVIWGGLVFAVTFLYHQFVPGTIWILNWINTNVLVPIVDVANKPYPTAPYWQIIAALFVCMGLGIFYGWAIFAPNGSVRPLIKLDEEPIVEEQEQASDDYVSEETLAHP